MALATDIRQQVFDLLAHASNISFVTADLEAGSVSQLTPGQRVISTTAPDVYTERAAAP